jgi:mannose-6-phosphate isomerase-like protein (cupin superfamily)
MALRACCFAVQPPLRSSATKNQTGGRGVEDPSQEKTAADVLAPSETEFYVRPGEPGHNQNKQVVWARWQKKRTFVRALEGTYGDLVRDLFTQPRVYRSNDMKWKGGPVLYSKTPINPGHARVSQSIECHLNVLSPHGSGQKHGHMNSAVLYIIKGKGHDVHDETRLEYVAGDALIVENACVHQHFNDGDDEMIVLTMKAKPLFLFMHMLFQKNVKLPPGETAAGAVDYLPPARL